MQAAQTHAIKSLLAPISWPLIMTVCIGITAYGFSIDRPLVFFNIAYLFLILSMFTLERFMPHERSWLESDGQFWRDILHTLSSKGTVQLLFVIIALSGGIPTLSENSWWPSDWPLVLQIILGLIIAEFGLYWAHRMAHEVPLVWRVHAIHHSVKRLWFVNTGRFHIIDALLSIVFGLTLLILAGAPEVIIKWVSIITAFIGMLTHCNIEMRPGFLSLIFNTPELHRWHHSKDLREGDKNYGENLMLWDMLFGTYFREEQRRPPVDIGLKNGWMPPRFRQQLLYPFMKQHYDQQEK